MAVLAVLILLQSRLPRHLDAKGQARTRLMMERRRRRLPYFSCCQSARFPLSIAGGDSVMMVPLQVLHLLIEVGLCAVPSWPSRRT